MLDVYGDEGCNNYLHHAKMAEYQEEKENYAVNMDIYIPMFKRCKECLDYFVKEKIRKVQEGPDQSEGRVDSNFTNAPDITNAPEVTNNPINLLSNNPINSIPDNPINLAPKNQNVPNV
eukprot:10021591-Ditylum_brightwellii.AAC.1